MRITREKKERKGKRVKTKTRSLEIRSIKNCQRLQSFSLVLRYFYSHSHAFILRDRPYITPCPLSGWSKEVAEAEEGGRNADFHQEDSAALSSPWLDIVFRWAHFGWAVSFQSLHGTTLYVIA